MKKIFFALFILVLPLVAKAECTTQEITRLKTLASKITVTYDYEEKDYGVVFSATFHNVHKDLKIIDNRNNKAYSSKDEFADITLNKLGFPGTYSVDIQSKLNNCKDEKITAKYYTVPYYNSYYKDPLCVGNETKKVCQKWTNTTSLTYTQFQDALKNKVEEQQKPIEEQKSNYNLLADLFVKYYYVLFGGIIVISLTFIIIINRKDRFNFDT